MMDLRHLRMFVALAEELHFGRAAARVRTTQSAVSQQLKRLEDVLKVELVSRSRAHVSLTAPGAVFLEHAQRILIDIDEAAEAARRAQLGEVGRLVVALSTPALYRGIPRVIRGYRARWPDVALSVKVLASDEQEDALLAGKIDAGFTGLAVRSAALQGQEIGRERFCVGFPEGHPLATQRSVRLSELGGERFIMVRRAAGPILFDEMVNLCREAGFDIDVAEETVAFPNIIGLVMAGVGLAFVPPSLASLGHEGMAVVPIEGPAPELPIYLAQRVGDSSPTLQCFLSFFQNDDSLRLR